MASRNAHHDIQISRWKNEPDQARPELIGLVSWTVRLCIRLVVLAVIIGIVAAMVGGIDVHGGFGTQLWIAVLFSMVNLILGPVFRLLSLPLIVVTLGLFLLVVNAALLAITAGLSSKLDIDNFGSAVLGGFLIAVFSGLVELLLPLGRNVESS
jgi:putative membrane protein